MRKLQLSLSVFVMTASFTQNILALQHEELMWGIRNNGGEVINDVDPLQSFRLQGVKGMDIHLLPEVIGRKVKVAIIDTGIDTNHPDLKNYIFKNTAKCAAYEKFMACVKPDADTGGVAAGQVSQCRTDLLRAAPDVYPADCKGWSILDGELKGEKTPNNIIGRPDFADTAGHGTHVAGTVLSVTKNIELIPVQVIGVGPNKPVQPYSIDLKPSEDVRNGYQTQTNLSERIARGLIYAMDAGAEVINLSLGWPEAQNSDIIRDVIVEAQRRHILIVAAAGNDSTSAILRPCQFKNVICVAASRPDGSLAGFSNFGVGVDIAAPGVEILSTIPMGLASVRLPGYQGYDYLSGTSQATPMVTGVIAEMLSRGIPADDIYPRLILGARTLGEELPVIKGPINLVGTKVDAKTSYKKTVLSGLLDMQRSVDVKAQPLLLPADKETQIISWDRKTANLSFQFKLKNYWKDLEGKKVSVQVRSTLISAIEPAIVAAEILENKNKNWARGEERSVKIDLQIRDNKNPSLSRLPRELSYQIYVMIDGQVHRRFEVKAEVLASLTKDFVDPDITTLPIKGVIPQSNSLPPRNFDLTPVDQVLDADQARKDYFLIGNENTTSNTFDIALAKMVNGSYEIQPTQTIKFAGNMKLWSPRYKMRMDIDGDGNSEYVFGVVEYLDQEQGVQGPYRNHFYIFDQDMHLKQTALFDDKRLALPFKFYWMKVGHSLRPAFVANGPKIVKNWDITDLWAVSSYENVATPKDIRLFYLDENFKLAQLDNREGSRIVEVIQPTVAQTKLGILPVLIAKNTGTDLKRPYIYEFTIEEIRDGRSISQKSIASLDASVDYRNLIDTMSDPAFSINSSASEYLGTMWYGLDAHKKQRVTLLDLEQSKLFDKLINSQRQAFDAALQVRAGFQSNDRRGVFLMTNSEIEFHELKIDQVATRSLNRYTFFGDSLFTEVHMPITIVDRAYPGQKLPALYLAEGIGFEKGIKIMVPIYTDKGLLEKIVAPARLSFRAAVGCRSLASPLFMGEGQGYALDYFCGDQIKRLMLKY